MPGAPSRRARLDLRREGVVAELRFFVSHDRFPVTVTSAAGPWSESLLDGLGMKLQVLRKHQYWFAPNQAGYELDAGFPCFFHETQDGFFYGFPAIDDSGVKVARHSGGQPVNQPISSNTAAKAIRCARWPRGR